MGLRKISIGDRTKYVLIHLAPLTPSGMNEIVASAETRVDCEMLAKNRYGGTWRRSFRVFDRKDLV